ncbi:MAG: hypothetical protein V1838_05255 [Patescibacteria group bacterium]
MHVLSAIVLLAWSLIIYKIANIPDFLAVAIFLVIMVVFFINLLFIRSVEKMGTLLIGAMLIGSVFSLFSYWWGPIFATVFYWAFLFFAHKYGSREQKTNNPLNG